MKHLLKNGFTLIEIIMTIAILSILLAIGAPALSSFLVNSRIKAVTTEMRDGLQIARMDAIRENNTVTIEIRGKNFDTSQWINGGWLITDSKGNEIRKRINKQQEAQLKYLVGNTEITGSAAVQQISFSGDGRASMDLKLDIKQEGSNICKTKNGDGEFSCLRIEVKQGGMIKSCNPAIDNSPESCE